MDELLCVLVVFEILTRCVSKGLPCQSVAFFACFLVGVADCENVKRVGIDQKTQRSQVPVRSLAYAAG